MWHPKQLLDDEAVVSLRQGGFSESQIEFLGWLSYNAAAINNSRNPVKAAHTILTKPKVMKMVDTFIARKKASVAPPDAPDHDEVNRKFRKLDQWAEPLEAEARPRDLRAEAAAADE
jgi:hypothetical protein